MEEMSHPQGGFFQFESPKHQSSYIKVIGVGGGGTNAVNHMYNIGIQGVDFIICNTDDKSLDSSPITSKIKLGKNGLGAGNIPSVARDKAFEIGEQIKEILSHNTQMLFITAGMGGGTGTGAAPVIAKLAKEIEIDDDVNKILVVAIVTLPFSFEGRRRRIQAEEGIKELRKHVDAILIINNDKLRDFGKMGLREAFSKADDILLMAAKGIAEIITVKSYINIDFRDINTIMQNSGVALMGSGIADGINRASNAIEIATTSALLNDNNIKGAKNILLYLASGSEEIDMDEIGEITDYIRQEAGMDVDIIWGAGFDDSLGGKLSITLIATGFETKEFDPPGQRTLSNSGDNKSEAPNGKNVFVLDSIHFDDIPKKETTPSKEALSANLEMEFSDDEPILISKSTPSNNLKTEENNTVQLSTKKPFNIEGGKEEYVLQKTDTQNTEYEDFVTRSAERINKIHKKLQTTEGVNELEKIPAYKMFGLSLDE